MCMSANTAKNLVKTWCFSVLVNCVALKWLQPFTVLLFFTYLCVRLAKLWHYHWVEKLMTISNTAGWFQDHLFAGTKLNCAPTDLCEVSARGLVHRCHQIHPPKREKIIMKAWSWHKQRTLSLFEHISKLTFNNLNPLWIVMCSEAATWFLLTSLTCHQYIPLNLTCF